MIEAMSSPTEGATPGGSRPARFYRPELDILRFLAFLMVFVHHATPRAYLNIPAIRHLQEASGTGLQTFFLLSAYLITELLLREREQTGTIHLAAFFKRRMLRIWPLYFLCIAGYKIATLLHPPVVPFSNGAFFSFMLLAGNWYVFRHGFDGGPGVFGALWSISIEEQFYLIWPFLIRFGGRRALWITCGITYAIAFLSLLELGLRHAPRYASWSHTGVELQFFASGAVLALLLHSRRVALSLPLRCSILGFSIAAIGVATVHFHLISDGSSFAELGPAYLLVNLGVAGFFFSFHGAPIPQFLRPVAYLGKISYGLYAFHGLGIMLAAKLFRGKAEGLGQSFPMLTFVLPLVMTFAIAILSYRFFETPFLRLKRNFTYVRARED